MVSKLRYKGIDKFIAYEVDLALSRERYVRLLRQRSLRDLDGVEDMRVLDFNGHQIMANFSLKALGDPIKYGSEGALPGRPAPFGARGALW